MEEIDKIIDDKTYNQFINKIIDEIDQSDYPVCWHDQDTDLWKIVIASYNDKIKKLILKYEEDKKAGNYELPIHWIIKDLEGLSNN